jgi:hypothetical protein
MFAAVILTSEFAGRAIETGIQSAYAKETANSEAI